MPDSLPRKYLGCLEPPTAFQHLLAAVRSLRAPTFRGSSLLLTPTSVSSLSGDGSEFRLREIRRSPVLPEKLKHLRYRFKSPLSGHSFVGRTPSRDFKVTASRFPVPCSLVFVR
jgi:hypothetical protein